MELAFTARVQVLGRVAIPKDVREALLIEKGDLVSIRIRKLKRKKREEE
jgi:AbrB family looped-hinge helix DNA binding protein